VKARQQIETLARDGQRRALTPALILFIALPEAKDNIDPVQTRLEFVTRNLFLLRGGSRVLSESLPTSCVCPFQTALHRDILSRRRLEVAADDAPGWVPRGSGYHRPHGVGVAAVAVAPPAYRAILHSYRVVPYSQSVIGSAYAAGAPRSDSIPDPV
jgi:hypothetical protein